MKKNLLLSLTVLGSTLLAVSAGAQVLLEGDTYSVRSDANNGRLGQTFNRPAVGEPSNPTGSYPYVAATSIPVRSDGSSPNRRFNAAIFYFELPELGSGLSVGNAGLSFTFNSLASGGAGTGNADLWGLGYHSSASIPEENRADFWLADDTDERPGLGISSVLKIQDNILTPEQQLADGERFSIDANASVALGVFLNSLYDAGAQAGDFAVFRINYDEYYDPNSSAFLGYNIAGSGASSAETDPTLSLTAIPEPSTVALFTGLAVLAGAFVVRRRSER